MQECVRTVSARCSECDRLERLYEQSVARIFALMDKRFVERGEKIRELHRLQDVRDEALALFYAHKKRHRNITNDELPGPLPGPL
jgi:hypothetical protein